MLVIPAKAGISPRIVEASESFTPGEALTNLMKGFMRRRPGS